jgi:aspartyl-tRNA(Asn)/glutamyl-tRNA(Gln) amidotransferase subunit A
MAAENLNAFITRERIQPLAEGPLSGTTVALKDNISTAGLRTTCGSATLDGYVPPYEATVVTRLREAGATIVGKTNMDEFGMGTTTETSAFGVTENPSAPGHVPGGSSGGSAAAVAAGEADVALGSDTGGSIRCPAAFCGVVGIKPTYGVVSRYGLIAYANSLEQIGPLAPTVEAAAETLGVIAGADPHDATTRDRALGDLAAAAGEAPEDLTIGIPAELLTDATASIRARFETAIAALRDRGATIRELSLPSVEPAVQAYYVIAMSEASSNLARFDGVRYGVGGGAEAGWNESFARAREEGFGPEVKRRVLLGTYALSAGYQDRYYKKAQDARAWIQQEFAQQFDEVDLLASPTMPVLPFARGEGLEDPLALYQADANTVPVNLADLPALSVPIGSVDGLPVGMQLIGPQFAERLLVQAGGMVERAV